MRGGMCGSLPASDSGTIFVSIKIVTEHKHLRNHPDDSTSRKRLQGLVNAARQIQKDAYPSIYTFAFEKDRKVY